MCKKTFFKSPFGMRSDSRPPNQLENPQNRIPINSPNETIQAHVANQPNPSRAIPIEPHGPHVSGHKNKNVTFSYPTLQSSESKDQRSTRVSESDSRREVKAGAKETNHKNVEDGHNDDPMQLRHVEGNKNNVAEDKFSDYISKVKNKFVRAVSNVGAARTTIGRRDSFNNKVSNYISRAKIKMRSVTMVVNDNNK